MDHPLVLLGLFIAGFVHVVSITLTMGCCRDLDFARSLTVEARSDPDVPSEALALWGLSTPVFAAAGFEASPALRISSNPRSACFAVCYLNRTTWESAIAAVGMEEWGGIRIVRSSYVEIQTIYGDRASLHTTNARDVPAFPLPPTRRMFRFPCIGSPSELLSLHREACRRFGEPAGRRIGKDQWWVQLLRESVDGRLDYGIERGWLRSREGGACRPTIKGAFVMGVLRCFPYRQLRSLIIDAESSRLCRSRA